MRSFQIKPGTSETAQIPFHLAHEKLEAYRMELSSVAWVADLLEDAEASGAKQLREAMDQLGRASFSALLNTAEGNGKRHRPIRARFFDDARGSATECAVCLDALVSKRAVSEIQVRPGKQMPAQIIARRSRLIEIFEAPDILREEETPHLIDGVCGEKEKEEELEKD